MLRKAGVMALIGASMVAFAPQAAAADSFNCRASAARVAVQGLQPVEPLVSGNTTECPVSKDGVDQDIPLGGLGTLKVRGARTSTRPFAADATVASVEITGLNLKIEGISASGAGSCTAAPVFSGTVATITLAGQAISPDQLAVMLGNGISGSPAGAIVKIAFNENFAGGRRAVHLQVLPQGGGTALVDAVVAEVALGQVGDPCGASVPPPSGGCPAGSTPLNGYCVIREVVPGGPGTGGPGAGQPCPDGSFEDQGQCVRYVPVGPGGNPLLGTGAFVPLQVALGQSATGANSASPCRNKRFGKGRFAIVGTSKADRITGTNTSDRIFTFAGSDRISGGRGNDCVEAGAGNDRPDGGSGSDYLLGGTGKEIANGGAGTDRIVGDVGNDKLIGGSGSDYVSGGKGRDKLTGDLGNDKLLGGDGNDYIHTGQGRDRVSGGKGSDSINSSTAGPAAKNNCGPGSDTVRVNTNERRRAKNCERIFTNKRAR